MRVLDQREIDILEVRAGGEIDGRNRGFDRKR
jgi:hypothetical protein